MSVKANLVSVDGRLVRVQIWLLEPLYRYTGFFLPLDIDIRPSSSLSSSANL